MTDNSIYYAVKNERGRYYNGMNQFGELHEARLYKDLKWAEKVRFEHINITIVRVRIEEVDEVTHIEMALKKAKAIKPDVEGDGYCPEGKLVYDTWICPTCGSRYEIDYQDYDYCPKCGQHIDMSDIRSWS